MLRHLVLALIVACLPGMASAQFQWRDARGQMVFSDQPPPPNTPPSRILRTPRNYRAASAGSSERATAPAAGADAASTTPGYREKAMAFEKRRLEQAEAQASAEEKAREAARKASYCNELKAQRNALSSDGRIVTVAADGTRSYLDDRARQARLEDNAQALASNCGD